MSTSDDKIIDEKINAKTSSTRQKLSSRNHSTGLSDTSFGSSHGSMSESSQKKTVTSPKISKSRRIGTHKKMLGIDSDKSKSTRHVSSTDSSPGDSSYKLDDFKTFGTNESTFDLKQSSQTVIVNISPTNRLNNHKAVRNNFTTDQGRF